MLRQQAFRKYFFVSLLLHLVFLFLLITSFDFSKPPPVVENTNQSDPIEALVWKETMPKPKRIIQSTAKPIPIPAPSPPEKAAEPQTKTVKNEAIIAIPDKKVKVEQEKSIQKELLADLKKQAEKNKKQKQKELQMAFEKEMKEMKAKTLQDQMLQEKKRLSEIKEQKLRGVVDKYKALILQAIGQQWRVPPNANKKRFAELLIRLMPGGVVLEVQLTKSSGEEALDRSARAAVFKASPLPVPDDHDSFEPFRQFVLKVKPENIIVN